MKALCSCGLVGSLVALMVVPPALAYDDVALSSEAIREAYFLAKQDLQKRQAFFQPYRHELPVPKSGPDVAAISIKTPFAFIVDRIAVAGPSYYAQDAEQDYLGKPEHFGVHVEVYFTATYPTSSDTPASLRDFWKNCKVRLKQEAEIPAQEVTGGPIYDDQSIIGYVGATIDADYDPAKVDSAKPATVEVDTPDGQRLKTTFDLARLQ